jgi:hypothetical protein
MKIKVYTIEFGLPRWVKRGLIYVGIPATVLLGIGAAVKAASTLPQFTVGSKLSSTGMNALVSAINEHTTSINTLQAKFAATNITFTSRSDSAVASVAANALSGWKASPNCNYSQGEFVAGGGCSATAGGIGDKNVLITASYAEGAHWACYFKNNDSVAVTVTSWVMCGKAVVSF